MTIGTLTPQQIEQAKQSPLDFAEVASGGWYKRAKHLELLNNYLLRCASRDITRLMVFMPPRHGKSETISHFLPAWWLGSHPDDNVICVSHTQELADAFGRLARNTLEDVGEAVFGVEIADDSSAKGRWQVQGHRGGFKAAGVGGSITGRGANLMIIDDPIKTSEEAWSATVQAHNADWWSGTAYTRLEPGAVVILLMTRWHQEDLAGRILRDAKEPWAILELPAIAGDDDQMGRERGEALWPSRYSEEDFARIKNAVGDYYWQAEYQQRPELPEGFLYFDKEICEAGRDQVPAPRQVIHTSEQPGMPADGAAHIWERRVIGEWYYAGADTADGKGEAMGTWGATGGPDRNVLAIYRGSDHTQVAEIYGRQKEPDFARLIVDWCTHYNNALVCIENNRRAVLIGVQVLGYKQLYSGDRQPNVRVRQPVQNIETRREYGFNTNTLSRGLLLSEWREALHSGEMRPRSKRLYEESLVFVQGDPPAAMPGQHDDTVFAHALAKKAKSQAGRSRAAGTGLQHIGTSF